MVYSDYTKQRVLSLYWRGYLISQIVEYLQLEDHIQTTKQGVRQFLKRYKLSKSISWKPGSGMPPKLSPELQKFIEDTMRNDDETTATQLQAKLASMNIYVSLATIVRNRVDLGWTYRGSAYSQLIRQPNKAKRLAWAHTHINDEFSNVICSDETTVQIETSATAIARLDNNLVQSLVPSIQPKYMYGQVSAKKEQRRCAFLRV